MGQMKWTTKTTMAMGALCATLAFSQVAEAACQWNLEGRIVRTNPLQTDDGDYAGPGYPVEMMAMVRWRDITLCGGNTCPWNTTLWVPTTSDDAGNFTIPSLPHPDPTCQFERDFILMMQAPDVDLDNWQEVESRSGVDGPNQPSGPVPWPTFVHVVEFGNIEVDDLPLPDWYEEEEELQANNGAPGVGNATMEPAAGSGPSFPTGTLEPNTTPFPMPDTEDEDDDESGFPHGTLEPNTTPFPFPNNDENEDESEDDADDQDGNQDTDEEDGDDTGDDTNDSAPDFTDMQIEEMPPCIPPSSGIIEQADFAFGPHPSTGGATGLSPDGLVRIQQRHSGTIPMARRLSVTFEVENHGGRFVGRSGECPVEVQIRFNEGPGLYGDGEDAWHTYEDDMPTINANWQRFITMSGVLRGTGNDTGSSWNEGYEYARVEVVLDHTDGVNEANEGDNTAGLYCYHGPTNAFVDMGTCDAAEGTFD